MKMNHLGSLPFLWHNNKYQGQLGVKKEESKFYPIFGFAFLLWGCCFLLAVIKIRRFPFHLLEQRTLVRRGLGMETLFILLCEPQVATRK